VTYLLDVNALLALAHASHELHGRTESWVRRLGRDDRLATCAITELGFVRIGPQARLSPGVGRSVELLSALKRSRRPRFTVLGDRLGCEALPPWAMSPGADDGRPSGRACPVVRGQAGDPGRGHS
jgi:hypothetical protein